MEKKRLIWIFWSVSKTYEISPKFLLFSHLNEYSFFIKLDKWSQKTLIFCWNNLLCNTNKFSIKAQLKSIFKYTFPFCTDYLFNSPLTNIKSKFCCLCRTQDRQDWAQHADKPFSRLTIDLISFETWKLKIRTWTFLPSAVLFINCWEKLKLSYPTCVMSGICFCPLTDMYNHRDEQVNELLYL